MVGFGTFGVRQRKARTGRNPQTGATIQVSAKRIPKFNPGKGFRQNQTECPTHSKRDITIAFIENNYDPDPKDTTYESTFVYLIRRSNELTIETDRHLAGIFPRETWLALLRETGFDVKVLDIPVLKGIPLLVCTKSSQHVLSRKRIERCWDLI